MSLRGVCERRWSRDALLILASKQHSADRRGAVCRQETGPAAAIMAGGSERKTRKIDEKGDL